VQRAKQAALSGRGARAAAIVAARQRVEEGVAALVRAARADVAAQWEQAKLEATMLSERGQLRLGQQQQQEGEKKKKTRLQIAKEAAAATEQQQGGQGGGGDGEEAGAGTASSVAPGTALPAGKKMLGGVFGKMLGARGKGEKGQQEEEEEEEEEGEWREALIPPLWTQTYPSSGATTTTPASGA
jgi:hypothetical protein